MKESCCLNPAAPAECNGFMFLLYNDIFLSLLLIGKIKELHKFECHLLEIPIVWLLSELLILAWYRKKELVANDQREFICIHKAYLINTPFKHHFDIKVETEC